MQEKKKSLPDGKASWGLRVLRQKYRLHKMWERIAGTEKNIYVWDRIPFYKQMWQDASKELSAQFIQLADGIWEVRSADRLTRINIHKVQLDDPVISSIAGNKPLCYAELMKGNIPVPAHLTFRLNELASAREFMKKQKGFFVVKPAVGTSAGMGITTHIKSYHECWKAIALASLYGNDILIEQLIPGESYRFLILNGKFIHAVRRRGMRVRGDGQSTIRQLIVKEDKLRRQQRGHTSRGIIRCDRDMDVTLLVQKINMESVPEDGQNVLVKSMDSSLGSNVEVRTVYTEDVTDLIADELRAQAERTAEIFSSQFTGVDIITLDPTVSLEESGGVVTEINTNPGLHHHYHVLNSGVSPPAVNVLRHLLKIPAGKLPGEPVLLEEVS